MTNLKIRNRIFLILSMAIALSCTPRSSNKESASSKHKKPVLTLGDYRLLDSLNVRLVNPAPGNWRYSQKESVQSFASYINSEPACPGPKQYKIYIQLIGDFDSTDLQVLQTLEKYITIFYGLPVVVSGPFTDSNLPENARRMHCDHEQLHTRYILYEMLAKNFPDDAIVNTAITSKDLYPSENWNFVFGEASLNGRIGVSSIYHFRNDKDTPGSNKRYVERIIKTCSHEIGHMFGIKHCTQYKCLMNGSMSLVEADNTPTWLCGKCLAKVMWCSCHDVIERCNALIQFFREAEYPEKVEYYRRSKEILLKLHE